MDSHFSRMALLLACFVFNSFSAPVTYPNRAFAFRNGSFSPVPGFTNLKAFAVEGDRMLGVRRDGRLVVHGYSGYVPTNSVIESVTNAVAVGLSYTGEAVLTEDCRVINFGDAPAEVSALTNVIVLDVCGQANDDDLDYKLAVTGDGRVVVWGRYEVWHPLSADVPGVVSAAGGWSHIVALKGDGTVVQWDVNTPPAAVAGLSNVVAVAAGANHSVALKADGTVTAWGENYFGELEIPPGLSNVVAIIAAEYHTLALKEDGTLVAWGRYEYDNQVTPPAGLSNVLAVATSVTTSLALVSGPPRPAALAIAAAPTGAPLTLALTGEPGASYAIEQSTDLRDWQFTRLVTVGPGDVTFQVGNTNATGQFFRAR